MSPVYRTRIAGIYRCRYVGTTEKTLTDQDTGEEQVRWLWRFQELADPTSVGEIAKFTGTDPKSPNSNAHKMLAGVMGHKPQDGDDTDTQIGKVYDVVYGLNQAGNLTITSVVLVPEAGEVIPEPSQPVQDAPGRAKAPAPVSEPGALEF